MNRPEPRPFRAIGSTLLAVAISMAAAACAPDAWRPDNRYDAFLDQVQKKCGEQRIGSRRIGGDLLQNADAYFLDVTSRFFHGEVSEKGYVDALAGSFDASPDSPGIRCILTVMGN